MARLDIEEQAFFLYHHPWTPEIDSTFIDTLLSSKKLNKWKKVPGVVISWAGATTNLSHGTSFNHDQTVNRVKLLEKRFRTFKEIDNYVETHFNPDDNTIYAAEEVWHKILRKNNFARAYYWKGEPEYHKLAQIFGEDNVKEEPHHNMRKICSSSKETVILSDDKTIVLLSDEEEVTSPVMKSTRRKLFDDDQLSCTNAKDPGRDNPPQNKESSSKNSKKETYSSCASSSPNVIWKNPFN